MNDNAEDEAKNQPLLGENHVDSVEEDGLFAGIQLEVPVSGSEAHETPAQDVQTNVQQIPLSQNLPQSIDGRNLGAQVMGAPVYSSGYDSRFDPHVSQFPNSQHGQQGQHNALYMPRAGGPAPGGIMHLPDLPDAIEQWKQHKGLLRVWMILSIVSLILGITFWPGMLVGLLGTIGGSLHVCKCCKGDPSLAGPILTTYILAIVCAVVDSLLSTFLFIQLTFGCSRRGERDAEEEGVVEEEIGNSEEDEEGKCAALIIIILIIFLWFLSHAILSVQVARAAERVRKLLNPITSGVVIL